MDYIEGTFNCCANLLSRLQTVNPECEEEKQSEHDEPDIKHNFFEVNLLNSNALSLKDWPDVNDELIQPFIDIQKEINIKESQQNDEQIKKMKNRPNKGTTTATEKKEIP